MQRHYLAYLNQADLDADKATLINKYSKKPGFVYGDDFVRTEKEQFTLKVVQVTFPLANFSGYDIVHCPDIIDKIEFILSELKSLSGIKEDAPTEPEKESLESKSN